MYQEQKTTGINNENKVETLEFEYPPRYTNYLKTIEMQDGDWLVVDTIENDRYVLKNNVTSHKFVSTQIVFRDMSDNTVFKSEVFEMKFDNALNATEEIEEENKDIITELVDAKFDAEMEELDNKYVAQEEGKGLSENDFTDTYKNDVDDLVGNINTLLGGI